MVPDPTEIVFSANRFNRVSVALPVERNSGMDRCDLADLTVSVAVADQLLSRTFGRASCHALAGRRLLLKFSIILRRPVIIAS
jgi:hypothetical protein